MSTVLSHLTPEAFPDAKDHLTNVERATRELHSGSLRFFDDDETLKERLRLKEENSEFLDNILFVAEDRRGAYYGIWLRGKIAGMWSIFDPEEIDLSPAWRSTDDFIASISNGPNLPDTAGSATASEVARFRDIIAAYRKNLEAYAEHPGDVMTMFYAFTIMGLTPREELDQIVPFLKFPNQWIQERAAVTLGAFQYRAAETELRELSKESGNGGLAARGALKAMGL